MIKGTVQSLEEPKDANGDFKYCKVVLDNDTGVVTQPLNIPWNWRGCFGNIQVGDRVYCAIDDNLEGCILQRIDGDWDFKIKNTSDININKNINIGGNSTVSGNIEATDVKTSAVASVNAHTHTGNMGSPTSAPNG